MIIIAIVIVIILILVAGWYTFVNIEDPPSDNTPSGTSNTESPQSYEGLTLKCAEKPEIYTVQDGKKRSYPDTTTYVAMKSPQITLITCAELDTIPTGNPFTAISSTSVGTATDTTLNTTTLPASTATVPMTPTTTAPAPTTTAPTTDTTTSTLSTITSAIASIVEPTPALAQQYEGKTIKCPERAGIFTVQNGLRRKYPDTATYTAMGSPTIIPVTCVQMDAIPAGTPFPTTNSTTTLTLAQQYEGKAIKCSALDAVYKVENGKKQLYPNWDTYVANGKPAYTILTCAQIDSIPTGDPFPIVTASTSTLSAITSAITSIIAPSHPLEGKTIKVQGIPMIYTVKNGLKKTYPDWETYVAAGKPTIELVTFEQVNDTPTGSPFTKVVSTAVVDAALVQQYEGKTIRCDVRPFLFTIKNGTKKVYPDWNTYIAMGKPVPVYLTCAQIDSIPTGIPFLPVMFTATTATTSTTAYVTTSTSTLAQQYEGKTIKCNALDAIYKVESGKKRHYPDWDTYVAAGNPTWSILTCAQIDTIPTGTPLPVATPSTLTSITSAIVSIVAPAPQTIAQQYEGKTIKVQDMPMVYTVKNGLKKTYPDWETYVANGKPAIELVTIDQVNAIPTDIPFTKVASAAVLDLAFAQQNEGKTVRCSGRPFLFTIKNGTKKVYPDWNTYVAMGKPAVVFFTCVQVDSIPTGNPFPITTSISTTATTSTLAQQYEGKVIKCDAQLTIYKVELGKKRAYPDWNTYVASGSPAFTLLTCVQIDSIPTGLPFPVIVLTPAQQYEDKTIKVQDIPMVYTVKNGLKKTYPDWETYVAAGKPAIELVPAEQVNAIPTDIPFAKVTSTAVLDLAFAQQNEGKTVRCSGRPFLFTVKNGTKKVYPDWKTYIAMGKPAVVLYTCLQIDSIPTGTPFTLM
jgi:hypothetical protein